MGNALRTLGSLLFGFVLASLPRPATAATLDWNGPTNCSPDAFALKFEQITERQLESATFSHIRVVVRQVTTANWTLDIEIALDQHSAASTRTLKGITCNDVSHAAAVAVAMALFDELPQDADKSAAVSAAQTPSATPQPQPPLRTTLRSNASTAQRPQENASQAWFFPLFAMAVLDGGLLGQVAFGWRLGFGLAQPDWEASLSYAGLPETERAVETDLAARMSAHVGVATGCYVMGTPPVRTLLCANYEAGTIVGEGSGVGLAIQRRQVTFWHGIRPEAALHVALANNLDVRFVLGPTIALSRTQFVVDDGRVAHEIPAFSLRGAAGLAWTL